jgi:GTP-binding protein
MIDLVKFECQAGDGGHGMVSFRREKYVTKGGPDGGDGGHGGRILVRSVHGMTTLRDYAGIKIVKAEAGGKGGRKQCFGQKGEDKVLEVPVGTVIYVLAENKTAALRKRNSLSAFQAPAAKYYLEDEHDGVPPRPNDSDLQSLEEKQEVFVFTEPDQEIVLCAGGRGGRGNMSFKSSTKTTPLEAEYGGFGEHKLIQLELKLLADLGLVGWPNAGKSTFLSKVTRANPKIANYPFTTLEPNLGIMQLDGEVRKELVIADIPGLIEGASQGKGLGLDFLRHIENCQALMYVLYLDEMVVFDDSLSVDQKAELLYQQYEQLKQELGAYAKEMLDKSVVVTINKIDLYTNQQMDAFRSLFAQKNINVIFFSTVTGEGLGEVKTAVQRLLD